MAKTKNVGALAAAVGALVAGGVVVLMLVLVEAQPAEATFPGQNGRIAFVAYDGNYTEIYTINPDGTGLVQLTHNSAYEGDPAWSPDGESIAFSSNREPNPDGSNDTEVYVMSADGTNQRRVTDSPEANFYPAWSPSGEEITFQSRRHITAENPINTEIYVVRVDGTDERRLTNNTASDLMPDWSPSGEEIAYYSTLYSGVGTSGSDILVMNSDGTNQRRLTDTPGYDRYPDWSPDGREIIFQKDYHDFYKIRADGTGLTNLTDASGLAWYSLSSPTWAPDGTKLAFWGQRIVRFDNDIGEFILDPGIYLMNPDGSGVTKIPGTDSFSVSDLDWQPKTSDTTPPSVTSTSPKANATEVAPTANIRATFSEDMDSNTINGQTFKLFKKGTTTQIAAQVSYNTDTEMAKLDPTNNLRRGVAYKAVVSTWARDVAGNRLDQDRSTSGLQQKRWFFRVDD